MPNIGEPTQPISTQTPGRYQSQQRIGRGGMGDAWLAEDPRLRRQVAIKTLPTHNQQDHEYALRFEREAQAAQVQTILFPTSDTAPGHSSTIIDVAWSPGGRYLATTSFDKTVIVWQVDAA